jgi:hypothetical protein
MTCRRARSSSARRRSVTSRKLHAPAADPLRLRVALEHPAVLEFEDVLALGLGLRVELADPGDEILRTGELIENVGESPLVLAVTEHLLGDLPHLREAAVERGDPAAAVDHEEAVGRGLESGLEERERLPEGGVGLHQLLRAEIHRALEHRAVVVRLPVGGVDGGEERPELLRHRLRAAEAAPELAFEKAVAAAHHRSASVVMVIVWLCSSHRALGVKGEISP